MVQADQRTGFCEPVALNHHVAQPSPEFFSILVKRCATGNDGPEFPSKKTADFSESPPAFQEMLILGAFPIFIDIRPQLAAQLVFQRLHHARHRHQHGNAFALDGCNDVAGFKAILEMHGSAEQCRDKHSHELPEYMAEWEQFKKTYRLK